MPPSDAGSATDGGDGGVTPGGPRLFPSGAGAVTTWKACHLASPLAYHGPGGLEVIASVSDRVAALDPDTGALLWDVVLPAPGGEMGFVVATPLLVGDRLFVSYHTTAATSQNRDVNTARHRHRLAVVDLFLRQLETAFAVFDLEGGYPSAEVGEVVPFAPGNALGRAELVRGRAAGDVLGKLYVTFGNARDIQPWHGFAFEVDLDEWLAGGAANAVTAMFVDTPEVDCGAPGSSGSRVRICGGGLWAPSGPLVVSEGDSYSLVLASGNGQLDLARRDFANTLMRTGPGLTFEPGCEEAACAGFDGDAPSEACVTSCSHLFIPRMPEGEDFTALVSEDRCAGLSMFECWAVLDYIGGSTPAFIELPHHRVLLYPTKDGAVYLVDYDHLGTLYARRQLVGICGTPTSPCVMDWAGMIVTEPTVTETAAGVVALVPTFMPDDDQHAGLFALRVREDEEGRPQLEEAWVFPARGAPGALTRFRGHPSRAVVQQGEAGAGTVWVVEASSTPNGRLLAIDLGTGALVAEQPLYGRGYRFVEPLLVEDRLYLPSCEGNAGDSWIEGYDLTAVVAEGT